MVYCESCGAELSEGVKFCKYCGARIDDSAAGAKELTADRFFDETEHITAEEFFSDDDDAFVEDGEIDDSKGLDPNRSYHMRFSGRVAELYNDWGQIIRRYSMRTNVVQATTSGEMVTICTDDGYTHIYRWDGSLVRRFR